MGEVINLRRAKKLREKALGAAAGDVARAKSGRTKAAKDLEAARAGKEQRDLDGKKRDEPR
jgi:hypothetical protein